MTLEYDEMVTILEDLARHSPSAIAKIQAIKCLRLLEAERKEAEEEAQPSAFELQGLYSDEFSLRRRGRKPKVA